MKISINDNYDYSLSGMELVTVSAYFIGLAYLSWLAGIGDEKKAFLFVIPKWMCFLPMRTEWN